MRVEENSIILEAGDKLYRYDLCDNLPKEWSTNYSSVEYNHSKWGRKNAIGAFFFYGVEKTAKQTLAQAIYSQRKKGIDIKYCTLTYCIVVSEIKLLYLKTKLFSSSELIKLLNSLGIDIINGNYYNYKADTVVSEISDEVRSLLNGGGIYNAKIEDFFFFPQYFSQNLTDFENGKHFRLELEKMGFEGYVFEEAIDSDTYCMFYSNKLSDPFHNKIFIESDSELQDLISKVENNEKRMINDI